MTGKDNTGKTPPANEPVNKTAGDAGSSGLENRDDQEHSYAGRMDHVEGRMNNGELGGGLQKEEDNKE